MGDRLYRTGNGGRVWKTVALPATNPLAIQRTSAHAGWYLAGIGARTVLYRTTDGGVHWHAIRPRLTTSRTAR